MWRLFYPLRYFFIDNKEKKKLDFYATLVIGVVLATVFIVIPGVSFFRPNGFLDKLLTLSSGLTGFYVAALVAAATFTHPDLDKTIKAGPIVLIVKGVDGKRVAEHLTRREFACLIFGYLAYATFILSIASAALIGLSTADIISLSRWPLVGPLFNLAGWFYTRSVVIFAMSLIVGHVFVATSLGLYYLMDRLYRRDRQITTKKPGTDVAA